MAIQFPNFLAAQTRAPDYSGLGDVVENFYKGYNMPKDALIKEIQAKFAEPNAEADLQSTQLRNAYQQILNQYLPAEKQQGLTSGSLSNKKNQIDIDKAMLELQQQRELERQFGMALGGGNQQGLPAAATRTASMPPSAGAPSLAPNAPMMPPVSQRMPILPGMPKGLPAPPVAPGMTLAGSPPAAMQNDAPVVIPNASMQSQGMPLTAASSAPLAPSSQSAATPEATNEVVITKGAPQLSGVDAMYDSNPLSRAFLEKKGYKKTQQVKFDNKTGKTTVITKYPSGKVTVTASSGAAPSEEGIPLTNKMISKHQNIISSIDNALPTIQKILDEKGVNPYARWTGLLPGAMSQSVKYDAMVKSALDSLIGAYGLPMTNEGIDTVKTQLLIGHGETPSAYRQRLKELVKDLNKRKAYSSGEVKKSNKISPVDSSSSGRSDDDSYSSNDWEEM